LLKGFVQTPLLINQWEEVMTPPWLHPAGALADLAGLQHVTQDCGSSILQNPARLHGKLLNIVDLQYLFLVT
jgi:hypothetical protein